MTKKIVNRSIELLKQNRHEEALATLDTAERGYAIKRLSLLASLEDSDAAQAAALLDVLNGRRGPESLTDVISGDAGACAPSARHPDGVVPETSNQRPPAAPGSTCADTAPPQEPSVTHPTICFDRRLLLHEPESLLHRLPPRGPFRADLNETDVAQLWSLVALATLARVDLEDHAVLVDDVKSQAARFARALGVFEAINGMPAPSSGMAGRTVPLQRLRGFEKIEPTARRIAGLVIPEAGEAEESRRVVQYVIIELLRNVLQHSNDRLGAVVAAQRMDAQQHYSTPCIQIAVGDAGVGVLEAMHPRHPDLREPKAALEKALRPHISGTFDEGETGSLQNAGMGLFFVCEMAKLSTGRLMIASRGAALSVRGNEKDQDRPSMEFVAPDGTGFPGTLVAFELPLGKILNYQGLMGTINERARKYTPPRSSEKWVRFEPAPEGVQSFLVRLVAEDTVAAEAFSREQLVPRLVAGSAVALDFQGLQICTQSFLHALLFRAVRIGWAQKCEIFVIGADSAVRSGIETVQQYALAG